MKRCQLVISIILIAGVNSSAQQQAVIEINEFSQGTSGNKEFIELVVTGNKTCVDTTVDLSGWIIDDQNGWFAQGAGTAISGGHYRFANDANWKHIPIGSIILLYNDADKNTNSIFPFDDATDQNKDDVYVVPISSPLLEYSTLPANGTSLPFNYNLSSYTRGAGVADPQNWSRISLRDDGDVLVVVRPGGAPGIIGSSFSLAYYTTPFITGPAVPDVSIIISGASGSRLNYFFNQATGLHLAMGAWQQGTAGTGSETPGRANSTSNRNWIEQLRKHPLRSHDLVVSPANPSVCSTAVMLQVSNGTTGSSQWKWSPVIGLSSDTGHTVYANPTISTTYQVSGTDSVGCPDTAMIFVKVVSPIPEVVPVQSFCTSANATINELAPTGSQLTWYDSVTGGNSISAGSTLQNAVYYAAKIQDGCESARVAVSVTLRNVPVPSFSVIQPRCSMITGTIGIDSVGKGYKYGINGSFLPQHTFTGLAPGNYVVNAMDSSSCVSPGVSVIITPAPPLPGAPVIRLTEPGCTVSTGHIEITSPFGVGYSYSLNGSGFQQSTSFPGLAPAVYQVIVKDSLGCFSPVTITEVRAFVKTLAAALAIKSPDCSAYGSISINTSGGVAPYRYSLDGNNYSKENVFSSLRDGSYSVYVSDAAGCMTSMQTELRLQDNFRVQLLFSPQPILQGNTINLQSSSLYNYKILEWLPKSLFQNQASRVQQFIPDSSVTISVVSSSPTGCIDTASIFVPVQQFNDVYVPNAFSPNGDGRNDVLKFRGRMEEVEWIIFNRFGQVVFRSTSSTGWNGEHTGVPQPTGAYVYVLRGKSQGKQVERKGTIVLLR